jgi:nucleotide-binding universal stress UspA family protein
MLRVLAATDLSRNAEIALSRAICLAAENGAALRVLHVPDAVINDQAGEVLRQLVSARVRREAAPDLDFSVSLRGGDPVDAILEEARGFQPDLLVIGGHRRMRMRDALFGTTATRLLARTRIPMLVARSGGCFPYARILAALDTEQAAEGVLRLAMRLASARHVFVVHAFPVPPDVHVPVDPGLAGAEREHRRAIEQIVRDVAPSIGSVHVHVDVEPGDAFRVIDEAVKQIEPNLLVLGSHGRRGLERMLFGNLAEDALAYFEMDILVMRADEADREGEAATEGAPGPRAIS